MKNEAQKRIIPVKSSLQLREDSFTFISMRMQFSRFLNVNLNFFNYL